MATNAELQCEVPYGELYAKSWGQETEGCKRVLALHSLMDNSASFDKLVPHLQHDQGFHIVAIDLPGHGKSSQFSPGGTYNDLSLVAEIRRFVKELNWQQPVAKAGYHDQENSNSNSNGPANESKKFSIIAHSFGGFLGLYYSSLFPNDVDEIIMLDFIKSKTGTLEEVQKMAADAVDKFLDTVPSQPADISHLSLANSTNFSSIGGSPSSKQKPDKGKVVVTQDAAIQSIIDARKEFKANLTREEATCLLERASVPVSSPPNSVLFSRDMRLNCMVNIRETCDLNKVLYQNVNCHIICLLGKQGIYSENKLFKDQMDEIEEFLRMRSRSFCIQWIDADHYLHMNKCKETASIINNYLKSPLDYKVQQDC